MNRQAQTGVRAVCVVALRTTHAINSTALLLPYSILGEHGPIAPAKHMTRVDRSPKLAHKPHFAFCHESLSKQVKPITSLCAFFPSDRQNSLMLVGRRTETFLHGVSLVRDAGEVGMHLYSCRCRRAAGINSSSRHRLASAG